MSKTMEVAETILAQMGGRMMAVMIGAKDFVGGQNMLMFGFKAKAKNGANKVVVTLDASDTYTVEFFRVWGAKVTKLETQTDVYADNLVAIFERATGLYLHP